MKIELFIEHIAKNVVTAVSEMYPDVEVVIVDPSGKLIGTTEKYNQAKNNRAYTPYIDGCFSESTNSFVLMAL